MKRRLLVAAAVAAGLALAGELALRALGYSSPQWVQGDPSLGWALRPGAQGWFTDEGKAFVTVNAAGQRDRGHPLDKPAGTYRIAVLGDAYSEAMHVPMEKTYWAQLRERLESCGFQRGKRVEVLNFGVRGYGTAQQYLMLQNRALRYQPDLVLLQFTNGSDVRDNSYALDLPRKARPFFVPAAEGGLRLDDSFRATPAYRAAAASANELSRRLTDRSRLLQLARDVISDLRRMGSAPPRSDPREVGLDLDVLGPPQGPQWEEAWRVTELIVAGMRDLAASHGAKMALFIVPYAVEVHPDAALRAAVLAKYGVPDLAYPDRRIAAFARGSGILGITLYDEMRALAVSSGRYLYGFDNLQPGFSHWNERGHQAAAEIIARSLCAQLP
jgi:hypothetical protein